VGCIEKHRGESTEIIHKSIKLTRDPLEGDEEGEVAEQRVEEHHLGHELAPRGQRVPGKRVRNVWKCVRNV
jgi:hypothetical protein